VVLVAEDTDVEVTLLYHWNEEMKAIIYYQKRQQKCIGE
jgi:16S rRNA C1402 (ribose-2'-O) methylase RsmI